MTTVNADAVIETLVTRSGGEGRSALRESLRSIWESVADDLKPEEATVVMWALHPGAVVGSHEHRSGLRAVAASMYPSLPPGKAAARLRRVMKRPAVRAVLDRLRSEEALFALAQRATVRGILAEIALERPPVDEEGRPMYEPKDVAAHNRNRIAAADRWIKLDALDAPPPAVEADAAGPEEKRKKLLDRLSALMPGS